MGPTLWLKFIGWFREVFQFCNSARSLLDSKPILLKIPRGSPRLELTSNQAEGSRSQDAPVDKLASCPAVSATDAPGVNNPFGSDNSDAQVALSLTAGITLKIENCNNCNFEIHTAEDSAVLVATKKPSGPRRR
jgi:hypothetical protein